MTRFRHALRGLRAVYRRSELINSSLLLAQCDQFTEMPSDANIYRTEHISYLEREHRRCLADQRVGDWLAILEDSPLSADPHVAAELRVVRQQHESFARVPCRLAQVIAETSSKALAVWRTARESRDFSLYRPHLEAMIALKQEEADILRDGCSEPVSRHDAFYGQNDPGVPARDYLGALAALYKDLSPLIDSLPSGDQLVPPSLVGRHFPVPALQRFGEYFAQRIGLDPSWGRFVSGAAPVCFHLGRNDIRVVVRCDENQLFDTLRLTAHEVGHARYNHAIDVVAYGEPLSEAPSRSMHEANARLWEAIICKTPEFWEYAFPFLLDHFGAELQGISLEDFTASSCYAARSSARARTDDLTYCTRIGIVSEIEIALLDGTLSVEAMPEEYDRRMRAVFGGPSMPWRGPFLDPHWAAGFYGRYPTYILGSVYAAQLWSAMLRQLPEIRVAIRRGDFGLINEWLRVHVHQHGRLYPANDLMTRATGSALDPRCWIAVMHEQAAVMQLSTNSTMTGEQ